MALTQLSVEQVMIILRYCHFEYEGRCTQTLRDHSEVVYALARLPHHQFASGTSARIDSVRTCSLGTSISGACPSSFISLSLSLCLHGCV